MENGRSNAANIQKHTHAHTNLINIVLPISHTHKSTNTDTNFTMYAPVPTTQNTRNTSARTRNEQHSLTQAPVNTPIQGSSKKQQFLVLKKYRRNIGTPQKKKKKNRRFYLEEKFFCPIAISVWFYYFQTVKKIDILIYIDYLSRIIADLNTNRRISHFNMVVSSIYIYSYKDSYISYIAIYYEEIVKHMQYRSLL